MLQAKGFTVSEDDGNSLTAKGTIFGKASQVQLGFDIFGLCEVDVMIVTQVKHVWDDYNLIKGLLIEKYGPPTSDNTNLAPASGWLEWEDDETTGDGEVSITIDDDNDAIWLNYKSSETSQALRDEIATKMRDVKESRSAALDLL